jgi:alpha-L-fucosidase
MQLFKKVLGLVLICCCNSFVHAQTAPKPYGAIPSERQLAWQEREMYVIMHFTPTTFQNKEWGFGDADPAIFNPSSFNAKNIVAAVKAGGFKGLTIVAKHHDGFALWPTHSTEYNITKSPFRNGKGDLVKEMQEATTQAGLGFGIYCSPWDRNNANYSKPAYITEVYYKQLEELYSNYGQLHTVFYDGANGGDGFYGGAKEKRSIDASTYYNYEKIWTIVRKMQPGAAIFSDIGPDIRWVGNESGFAAETSWSTLTPISPVKDKKPSPGFVVEKDLPTGTRNGTFWTPAECDVPLRPGWFYHPEQDGKTKTPAQLLEIYYQSVGRSASFDLGIAPMPSGELHPDDIKNLRDFGDILKKTFAVNFATGATITATNTRAKSKLYDANHLIDNDRYSYWATDDSVTHAELVFQLKDQCSFNVIRLRENIKLGQRIEALAVDAWIDGAWKEMGTATSIGGNRLIRLNKTVATNKVRLRILKSPVCIALSDFGLFAEPNLQ